MTEFPVPLDNLISYVKSLRPGSDPLANVTDAFAVSTQLDEQADALIGYFVDQARRSGLSWSQIGGAMGVSKQAAQKRFVPPKPFSGFTARAANSLLAASHLAAADGKPSFGAAHLAAAQLSDPGGFAAKMVTAAGLTVEQVYAALGTGPAETGPTATNEHLLDLSLDDDARQALKGAQGWAVRLGHNYIGTEHILLSSISTEGPVREAFTELGLTEERAEQTLAAMMDAYQQGVQRVRNSLGPESAG